MRRFLFPLLAALAPLALVGALVAADSPFPAPPPAPPTPAPVLNLAADALYVVNSATDATLRVHPHGLVKVTKQTGPITIRGKFVDGAGALETRTFAGPCVYTVESLAGKSGRLELDLIPKGLKDEKDILSDQLDVNGGAAPQPQPQPVPPGPQPGPQPNPQPITGTPKQFVVVEDTTQSGAWRGAILGAPKLASWYAATFGPGQHHRLIDINADGDSADAVAYKKLAAGKSLPYLWVLDGSGKAIKDLKCPTDSVDAFIAAFDTHPGGRSLGARIAPPKLKWVKFGSSPTVPLIPESVWKEVDLAAFLPPVYDQNGVGQCASSSACTVYESARCMAGLPYVHVSAGDLYSRVNGGRDEGSMPEDNLNELVQNGVDLASQVPYVWNGRRPASDSATVARRKQNRIVEAYLCDSFEAMASALQQGFVIQEAIAWYDNFTPDSDGWLPARGRGNSGGHALCGYGLTKRNGVWGIKTRNSWNTSWGGSADGTIGAGNCVVPSTLFDGPNFGNVWAVRAVYQTGSTFPAPTSRRLDPFRERAVAALAW